MASQHHAGAATASPAGGVERAGAGRPGRHGRPSALRSAVHARLEEMRFRHGVFLMVTTGTVFVAAVTLITMALTGGEDRPPAGPPAADSSSASHPSSAGPTGHSPSPHAKRRPRTSASTMVGVAPSPPPPLVTSHPPAPATTPPGVPPWWRYGDPRDGRWHGSPPPWWHHH